jgi:lipid-binding SYLF domain-containing protein
LRICRVARGLHPIYPVDDPAHDVGESIEVVMLSSTYAGRRGVVAAGLVGLVSLSVPLPAAAASAHELAANGRTALDTLYSTNVAARALGEKAKGVLVFPTVGKGGFLAAAQSGNGVLFVNGKATSFYNISAASFGFQAGVQKFSYALFFMTPSAIQYLNRADGWAIGSGPSLVVVDEGFANAMNTRTLNKDVYAFIFHQQGLMGGIGLEGSKITQIHPEP